MFFPQIDFKTTKLFEDFIQTEEPIRRKGEETFEVDPISVRDHSRITSEIRRSGSKLAGLAATEFLNVLHDAYYDDGLVRHIAGLSKWHQTYSVCAGAPHEETVVVETTVAQFPPLIRDSVTNLQQHGKLNNPCADLLRNAWVLQNLEKALKTSLREIERNYYDFSLDGTLTPAQIMPMRCLQDSMTVARQLSLRTSRLTVPRIKIWTISRRLISFVPIVDNLWYEVAQIEVDEQWKNTFTLVADSFRETRGEKAERSFVENNEIKNDVVEIVIPQFA